MDGQTLARIGAIIFVSLAITATAVEVSVKETPTPDIAAPIAAARAGRDPLAGDLARCSRLGEAATRDATCLDAWATNRRRFLGQTGGAY